MIKIGEYIRTPYGKIGKITDIPKYNPYFDDGFILDNKHFIECGRNAMKKLESTPNIIELVQVGDYVNGEKVINIIKKHRYLEVSDEEVIIDEENIKSIVTKEQFKSMEYEVK